MKARRKQTQDTPTIPRVDVAPVFAADGPLSQVIPGYEPRAGQVQLAQAIANGIVQKTHVIAEASTGVGKSAGYLVAIAATGVNAIVATHTKALQQQLWEQEIPRLQQVFPHVTAAVLKGRSNYACFGWETRILTKYGAVAIGTLAEKGGVHTIIDGNGAWVDAEVKNFGPQRLYRLRVARRGETKDIYTTAEHRWFKQQDQNKPAIERTTLDLRPGDRLASRGSRPVATGQTTICPFGIARGIAFGDGTRFGKNVLGDRTATLILYGKKVELQRYFPLSRVTDFPLREEYKCGQAIRIHDLPAYFKELPDLDEAPSYLLGWLAGYIATDGCVSKDGTVTLSSASVTNLRCAQAICTRLGIETYTIREKLRTGIHQDQPSKLYSISLARSTLNDDFFLRQHHHEHATNNPKSRKVEKSARRWTVVSVEETDRVEDVYCAVVPTTHSFVLDGNILTGNCLLQMDRIQHGERETDLFTTQAASVEYQELLVWLSTDGPHGDLDQLPFPISEELREKITVDGYGCLGRKCPFIGQCYSQQAKERAAGSQIVIVNHAMLLLDLFLGKSVGLLPQHPVIVIDESHGLEDVSTSAFGVELTAGRWRVIERKLTHLATELQQRITGTHFGELVLDRVSSLEARMSQLTALAEGWFERIQAEMGEPKVRNLDGFLHEALTRMGQSVVDETVHVQTALEAMSNALKSGESDADELDAERWGKVADLADRTASWLGVALDDMPAEVPMVRYVERQERRRDTRITLKVKPVRVDAFLREYLWSQRTVIATSATLATGRPAFRDGDAFDYWRERVGADGGASLVIPSPFPFKTATRLYVPADPVAFDPTKVPWTDQEAQAAYRQRVCDMIITLLAMRRGGALVLCTSFAMVRVVQELIDGTVHGTIYVQGDVAPSELLKRFKADGTGVLIGTKTFWEGVDMPGTALQMVIIDRLPFGVPDDPLWDARCKDVGDSWFTDLALPTTLIALKQGLGRLMRRMDDRGVMAILDSRLRSKNYGKWILAGLPPAPLVGDVKEIEAFINSWPV